MLKAAQQSLDAIPDGSDSIRPQVLQEFTDDGEQRGLGRRGKKRRKRVQPDRDLERWRALGGDRGAEMQKGVGLVWG